MTREESHDIVPSKGNQDPGIQNGKIRFRSLSCIFDNPLLLHRLCRYLEQDGDTFVEISYSVEDALHLMAYVSFDVVITDFTIWNDESHGLLKNLRKRSIMVPVIYFTRDRDPVFEREGEQYGGVYYVSWGEASPVPEFDALMQQISALVPLPRPAHVHGNS